MTINPHYHNHSGSLPKMQRCQDYIHTLEDERRKIQVFRRELPLCLELVTQAIEACKKQLSGATAEYDLNEQSECSEQTSSDAPVLEEFIPLKSGVEQESKEPNIDKDGNNCKKSDWLRSTQLWNQTPDPPSHQDSRKIKKVGVAEEKRNGSSGAFHPFNLPEASETRVAVMPPASTSSSGSGGNKKDDKEREAQRKSRRCWSTELHRKFLQALQQLGGSHVATPKQIRELMKVDGLTNDEVKSHLQKYRLHTRRPTTSIQTDNNTQAPQFVVVGGIWVPPEYAAMAATTTSGSSKGVYAPIPTLPTMAKKQHSGSHDGGPRSHSPATSSSTHTTTASPVY